ncbi:MAG TPA: hypothetical protein VKY26_06205 [Actinomycetota bacterium]|nr:hypothetical protein [Actinomycetota bacterium]
MTDEPTDRDLPTQSAADDRADADDDGYVPPNRDYLSPAGAREPVQYPKAPPEAAARAGLGVGEGGVAFFVTGVPKQSRRDRSGRRGRLPSRSARESAGRRW